MNAYLEKCHFILKNEGIRGLIKKVNKKIFCKDISYNEWCINNKPSENELDMQRQTNFKIRPLISIIVPTFNTPLNFLHEMIESLQKQTYTNWELCIGDGSGGNSLLEKELNFLASEDKRIKYVILDKNRGISGNTNCALGLAKGEYIALLDHDDFLAPQALFRIVEALQEDEIDVFYTDEDFVSGDGKTHIFPILKPDYSEELLCSHNYITHFFVVRKEIITTVGGFQSEFDGAQDYDIIFRCLEIAKSVKHIQDILYHWRMHASSVAGDPESKNYAYEAGEKALEKHLYRIGESATIKKIDGLHGMYQPAFEIDENLSVSVVIANVETECDLEKEINDIYNNVKLKNIEIIIIDGRKVKEEYKNHKKLENQYKNLKIDLWDKNDSYAQINNYGANKTRGDYLLFLNSGLSPISGDAIREMLGICSRRGVGVVGAKVLYYDNTVRHAGILIGGNKKIEYPFIGIDNFADGYLQRPRINCNYSAVSGMCMMVSKKVFIEERGFNENVNNGISDVEFCYRIIEHGKRVAYAAHSIWKTRKKIKKAYCIDTQLTEESKRFLKMISNGEDPYYNKNFPLQTEPFSVIFKK